MSETTRQAEQVSVRALDAGFDPRTSGIAVQLRVRPRLRVDYDNQTIEGVPEIIAAALAIAKYTVQWAWPEMPEDYSASVVTLPGGAPALELLDPNDSSGARHQYAVVDGSLCVRRLPAQGDAWADEPGPPWWEPVRMRWLMDPHILRSWYQACGGGCSVRAHDFALDHIVAWAPNGRQVRLATNGVEIQPPRDNWWHRCADLSEARRWWYSQPGS